MSPFSKTPVSFATQLSWGERQQCLEVAEYEWNLESDTNIISFLIDDSVTCEVKCDAILSTMRCFLPDVVEACGRYTS